MPAGFNVAVAFCREDTSVHQTQPLDRRSSSKRSALFNRLVDSLASRQGMSAAAAWGVRSGGIGVGYRPACHAQVGALLVRGCRWPDM